MDKEMMRIVREEYHYKKPIVNLSVKDIYDMDDSGLSRIMENKLRKHI